MYKMKFLIVAIAFLMAIPSVQGQTQKAKLDKRNLTVKEWNTVAGGKTRFLDHITTYNADGKKIEEIEYANYGQKYKVTYEYNANNKCIKEVVYDNKNRPVRIKKFEYYPDGSKKTQYNYSPNGKLESTKTFEYIFDKKS